MDLKTINNSKGFTLVEVLAALTIVAVALIAGNNALLGFKANLIRQTQTTLAQICAENELINLKLLKQFPAEGEQSLECVQANNHFKISLVTSPTLNASFRRTNVLVYDEQANFILQISTVFSRY